MRSLALFANADRSIAPPRVDPDEINRIILALWTPGSDEYTAYETGLTTADFKLQSQLLDNAGIDKDIYKAFTAEQRRQAINAALTDKFGFGKPEGKLSIIKIRQALPAIFF